MGWRHFKNDTGSFKQVFYKDGGGVREVPLPSLDIDIRAVIHHSKEVIFPTGECKYGDVNQMELSLGDYAGKILKNFDIQGDDNQCFGKYLQAHGLHLSRCTFYLMTQERITSSVDISSDISDPEISDKKTLGRIKTDRKQDSKVEELDLASLSVQRHLVPVDISGVVCEKQAISIQYARENTSNYDSESSLIKCHSILECQNISSFTEQVDEDEDYNPCLHGFFISRIRIGQKCFLDCKFEKSTHNGILEKTVQFPSSLKTENMEGIILHEPIEIWGYDGDKCVLGVVPNADENVEYQWFRDDIPVNNGECSLYIVNEPGTYTCLVSYADLQQKSKPIQIISIEINGCETSVEPAESVKPNSYSNSTDLAVVKDFPVSKKVRIENSDLVRKPDDLEKKNSSCVKENLCFAAPEVKVDDLHIDYSTALGSGAFGTVYKGKWAGSVVAVKALTVTKRNRSIMLDMVEKEINISSRIRHPNIVLFLAVARAPTTIYLVHEYIDGCNMEDAIFDQETRQLMDIKPGDKLFILSQCVQGVAYLHALVPPVIHQDIKPSNIMIKKVCHTTKLCDLGVSRIKSARAASMCTTQIGNACGTPSYMAPECLIHNEKTRISSDIWSLGITLIEFATEEDAWSVDDVVDTVDAIKKKMTEKEPPIPNVNVKGVPEEVMTSIKLCVNYDKLLRPTAEDVLKCVSSV